MTDIVRAFECPNHGWFVNTKPNSPVGLYSLCPKDCDEWCKTQNISISELREKVNKTEESPPNEAIPAEDALDRIENRGENDE